MRRLLPIAIVVLVLAGAGATVAVASSRHDAVVARLDVLRHGWDADQEQGVPASSLQPLRDRAERIQSQAPWWSPAWLGSGPSSDATALEHDSGALLARVESDRAAAQRAADSLRQQAQADAVAAAQAHPAASTPTAPPPTPPPTPGPPPAIADLLSRTADLLATANADNLDPGNAGAIAGRLRAASAAGLDTTALVQQLQAADSDLAATIGVNDHVLGELGGLSDNLGLAAAEARPDAAALQAAYSKAQNDFQAARTRAQLNAVDAEVTALTAQLTQTVAAGRCSTAVPAGKVVSVSLSQQEAVFYENGCVIRATPVTTGRQFLRTPAGVYHVFYKTSPFTMVSPWPKGSPFWYPTSTVTWVLEFNYGGYFLHDAWWQPAGTYGPGSENTSYASHGCIHIPTPVMRWLYGWAELGTTVIVS